MEVQVLAHRCMFVRGRHGTQRCQFSGRNAGHCIYWFCGRFSKYVSVKTQELGPLEVLPGLREWDV